MELFHAFIIMLATAAISGLVSGKIVLFLASRKRKSKDKNDDELVAMFYGIVTACLMFCASYSIMAEFGLLAGLIGLAISVPAVCFVWVVIMGSSRAVEKILLGLMIKTAA